MKNIVVILFSAILFSNLMNAQLQPVKYSEGSQQLNGLFIKSAKKVPTIQVFYFYRLG